VLVGVLLMGCLGVIDSGESTMAGCAKPLAASDYLNHIPVLEQVIFSNCLLPLYIDSPYKMLAYVGMKPEGKVKGC